MKNESHLESPKLFTFEFPQHFLRRKLIIFSTEITISACNSVTDLEYQMLFSHPIPYIKIHAVNLVEKQSMMGSGIAICQTPLWLKGSCWHGSRIAWTNNTRAAAFVNSRRTSSGSKCIIIS